MYFHSMSSDAGWCRTARCPGDEDLRREAAILSHCRHPGVVELRSVDASDLEVTVVVDTPPGAPLRGAVLTVEEIAGVMAVVATTVGDLHDIGVAHGALDLDAVTLTDGGRPVLGQFAAARWLDGPPGRWPSHPLALADDRALGEMATTLLERCAPLAVLNVDRAGQAWWRRVRRRPPTGAAALAAWAAAAAGGDVRARRLAAAMAEEMPGARLPEMRRGRDNGPSPLPSFGTDDLADAAIDAWLNAPNDPAPDCAATEAWDLRPPAGGGPTERRLVRGPLALGAVLAGIGTALGLALVLVHPSRPRLEPAAASIPRAAASIPRAATTTESPPNPVLRAAAVPLPPPTRFCLSPTPPCTTVTYAGGVLTVGSARFAVGRPGDVVTTGRWTCGATPTLALLRPETGEIWIYPSWPGGPQSVAPIAAGPVASARRLAADASGRCDALAVTRADGTVVDLGPWNP